MLINADFRLGTSLDRTNFENSILRWVDFDQVDMTGQDGFPTVFINAELTNTTFRNTYHDSFTDWRDARLDTVSFDNVSGSGGVGDAHFGFVDAVLNDVLFQNSNLTLDFQNTPLTGVTFSGLTYGGGVFFNSGGATNQIVLTDVLFENNTGGNYDFDNVIMKNVTFKNEDLSNANFYGDTQLIGVVFNNVNLSGNTSFNNAQLQGITDWSGSTLTGINFNGQDLTGVNFSNITAINVDFQNAYLDDANFAGATLTQSQFGGPGSSLLGVNWRGATLDQVMMNGDFKGTNFSSLASATNSSWNNCFLFNTDFSGVDLSNSSFAYAKLDYANLSGATLDSVNFMNADLSYTDLSSTSLNAVMNFSGVNWFQTNLASAIFSTVGNEISPGLINGSLFRKVEASSADFSAGSPGSVMYQNLTFEQSALTGADFSNTSINNSQFFDSDVDSVDFSNANLSGVDFYGSDLSGTDFSDANLSPSVKFFNANLASVNFTNVDLSGRNDLCANGTFEGPTSISGITWTGAICPDGMYMDGSPGRQNCETDNHIPGCGV
jgi:uncharacterized protein YjbI with pentapeptide repeats